MPAKGGVFQCRACATCGQAKAVNAFLRLDDDSQDVTCRSCRSRAIRAARPEFDELTRKCSRCEIIRPVDQFKMGHGWPRRVCEPCRREQQNARTRKLSESVLIECIDCGTEQPRTEFLNPTRGRPFRRCASCRLYSERRAEGSVTRRAAKSEKEKSCSRCGLMKSISEFSLRTEGTWKSHCNRCIALAQRAKKYGISVDEYENMETTQAGLCRICDKVPVTSLRVDHDHATGRVRGLLCHECNAGIGLLGDDHARILRAAEYLVADKDALKIGGEI